jgi:photosystem II stability/assembly factor-like uncharacterized protein
MKPFKTLLPGAIIFCALLIAVESASAQTWTQISAPTNEYWRAVASSADGSRLAALADPNQIWFSTNSGTSWTSNTVVFSNRFGLWENPRLVSSADGSKLVAGVGRVNGGEPPPFVVGSTNFGSWSLLVLNPTFIASSADGTELVAAAGIMIISTNSGLTWTKLSGSPEGNFPVAISADGKKLVAAPSLIYTSPDSGNTWITNNVPAESWRCVASSANGNTLAAVAGDVPIYTSTNSGNTWTSNNAPNENWSSVAMSADGSKIVAVSAGNGIFTSPDSGNTWTSNNVPNPVWISVASSADGNELVAAPYNGGIWILQSTPSPQLNLASSSNGLDFSWIVPSTNFVLQENLDLTTTNWLTLTNTPMLNLSNLNDVVVLSPSNSGSFFRLMAQ